MHATQSCVEKIKNIDRALKRQIPCILYTSNPKNFEVYGRQGCCRIFMKVDVRFEIVQKTEIKQCCNGKSILHSIRNSTILFVNIDFVCKYRISLKAPDKSEFHGVVVCLLQVVIFSSFGALMRLVCVCVCVCVCV